MAEVEVPQAEQASAPKSRLMPILVLVGAVAAGGAAAFFGVRMFTEPASVEAAGAHSSKKKGHEKDGEGAPLYVVENLVVNPAGTKGQRFLIVTVALEGSSAEEAEELKHSDAQLRDEFLRILGGKTVDELTELSDREGIKQEMRHAAAAIIGKPDLHAIYLPQFVLQ